MPNDIYKRPPQKQRSRPRVLTVQQARAILSGFTPCYTLNDTTRPAIFVREEMTTSDTLCFIWRHPFTGAEHRFVVDFKTGVQRDLGPIRQALPKPQPIARLPAPKGVVPRIVLLPWLRF